MSTKRRQAVCITGSSRGLGKALALEFAENDFDIVLHGRDQRRLANVAEKIRSLGVSCSTVRGALDNNAILKKIADSVKKNNVCVFINNAAVQCPHLPFEKITLKMIATLYRVNLLAPVALMNLVYSHFSKRHGGTFININSASGLRPQYHRSIYCSSKWALRGFDETLRLESGKHNVRVLSVFPSRIKTRRSFTLGMNPAEVARKIFAAYLSEKGDILILDHPPFRSKEKKR